MEPTSKRNRPSRSLDNPMAGLARRVLVEAERAFDTAPALAAAMEPHLGRRYSDSSIYAYTSERSVPPGDVLLAAALAAGISLDGKLGLGSRGGLEHQVDRLWAEVAELHRAVARLEERLGGAGEPTEPAEGPKAPGSPGSDRRSRWEQWARRSRSSPPPPSLLDGRATARDRQLRG